MTKLGTNPRRLALQLVLLPLSYIAPVGREGVEKEDSPLHLLQ